MCTKTLMKRIVLPSDWRTKMYPSFLLPLLSPFLLPLFLLLFLFGKWGKVKLNMPETLVYLFFFFFKAYFITGVCILLLLVYQVDFVLCLAWSMFSSVSVLCSFGLEHVKRDGD